MTYRTRMIASVTVASAVHALAVMAPWDHGYPDRIGAAPPVSEPVVLQLQPPQQSPKRLIDIAAPTDDPVDALTNLIAEANSRAADLSNADSGTNAPKMDIIDEAERLAAPAAPKPAERPPVPPSPPTPEPRQAKQPAERMEVAQVIAAEDTLAREIARAQPPAKPQEEVEPAPATPSAELPQGQSRGTVEGGVKAGGFLNFEAKQHEFAPYLKVVRNRVERHWRQEILLRYSGATRCKAVLDCAIAPDGRLVEVTIHDAGVSKNFAEMCRRAVLAAGPFPPFPFEIPPGYRSNNIEIRWTFNYL